MNHYFIEIGKFGATLWKVTQKDSFTMDRFINITDFLTADYEFISMIHPSITEEIWNRIPETKNIVDMSSDNIEFGLIYSTQPNYKRGTNEYLKKTIRARS